MGFDMGQFFANLLLNAISRPYHERTILFEHIEKTWFVFVRIFTDLWKKEGKEAYTTSEKWLENILQSILNDTVLFAGCEVIRRTIGLAHVADLDGIEDEASKIRAKQHALRCGSALLLSKFPVHISVFKNVLIQTTDEVTA
jgi:5-methylthioribose kinase